MKDKWGWLAALATGIALILLGTLWFLQGSDVVHIQPVLCAADCEPVTGWHFWWQLAGVLTAGIGTLATFAARRRLRATDRRRSER